MELFWGLEPGEMTQEQMLALAKVAAEQEKEQKNPLNASKIIASWYPRGSFACLPSEVSRSA